MKTNLQERRTFLKQQASLLFGMALPKVAFLDGHAFPNPNSNGKRVGIIGLDTSHAPAFTKVLNGNQQNNTYLGYRVVAAYPQGSKDILSSTERIPAYTQEVKKHGVEIVDSIAELLEKVDVVLLETNDGRRHLEQALEVFASKKPVFIDKPMAASYRDAKAIFHAAERAKVPVFSASSLRFDPSVQAVAQGQIGQVFSAEAFSPMKLEKTHPDLFWYGIHGVESLMTMMGPGCQWVQRSQGPDQELVLGQWRDGRLGLFRGIKNGKADYGGMAFGSKGNLSLGPYTGYDPLLLKIVEFFETGKPAVSSAETLEILAFMEAADLSHARQGARVYLSEIDQAFK